MLLAKNCSDAWQFVKVMWKVLFVSFFSAHTVDIKVYKCLEAEDKVAECVWPRVTFWLWVSCFMSLGCVWNVNQLVFWKNGDRSTNRTEDIILREWNPCPPVPFTPSRRRRSQSVSGHTSRLWPYSQITAGVLVLNGGRAGQLSDTIEFNTPEGRTHHAFLYFLLNF